MTKPREQQDLEAAVAYVDRLCDLPIKMIPRIESAFINGCRHKEAQLASELAKEKECGAKAGAVIVEALKRITSQDAEIARLRGAEEERVANAFDNGIVFIAEDAAKRLAGVNHSLAASMIRRCAENYIGKAKYKALVALADKAGNGD